MAFPGFSPAQLLAVANPTTPLKSEGEAQADAIRYLAAGGPLFQGIGFPGTLPGGPEAYRALASQSGLPFPLMYPGIQSELKSEIISAGAGAIPPGFFFDTMGYHPYGAGLDGARRKNATRETTAPLKQWLSEHRKNPYPTKGEKVMLAVLTKMTLTQVSTWFANARRRLKKENKMTWSPRNRPGEDDDDDFADVDIVDRPSSSTSDLSILEKKEEVLPIGDESNNNTDDQSTSPSPSAESDSPKKRKIWSIAESLPPAKISNESEQGQESRDEQTENDDDTAGSSKKSSPSAEDPPSQMRNPFLAWQQQLFAMSRLGQVPAFPGMMGPRPGLTGLASGFPLFNPMLLAGLGASAAQVAPNLSGSWSEGQSISPVSSNLSAAAPSQESSEAI